MQRKRPDYFIANSQVVADRIRYAFGVDSTVIPPPIDTARFKPSASEIEELLPGARAPGALQAS